MSMVERLNCGGQLFVLFSHEVQLDEADLSCDSDV